MSVHINVHSVYRWSIQTTKMPLSTLTLNTTKNLQINGMEGRTHLNHQEPTRNSSSYFFYLHNYLSFDQNNHVYIAE